MIATINQFQSMQTAEKVRGGLKQKASVGGTYSWAPVGYLHVVDHLPDGRKVRTVAVDPERAHFVTAIFELYASGEYSLSQLATELGRLGLTTRPTPKRGPRPVSVSTVQRLLRNRYYVGDIVYKRGKPDEQTFAGRHDPLIDPETFERVQLMLDHKRTAGERSYRRSHYLKGSVFCGDCGNRLVYGLTTGRNGTKYPYFFCAARINGTRCAMRFNIAPSKLEDAISEHYRTVQLTPAQVERAKDAIRALAAVSEGALHHIRVTKQALIAKLEERQDKLLDLYDEESISKAVFARRQSKLEDELQAARTSLAETDLRLAIDQAQLARALELAADVRQVYLEADDQTRRGYNQAFFEKLLVVAESEPGQRQPAVEITSSQLTKPYAVLLAKELVDNLATEVEAFRAGFEPSPSPTTQTGTSNADPGSNFENMVYRTLRSLKSAPTPVSNFEQLVPGVGFEPTRPCGQRIVSPPCLPFHHPGGRWECKADGPAGQAGWGAAWAGVWSAVRSTSTFQAWLKARMEKPMRRIWTGMMRAVTMARMPESIAGWAKPVSSRSSQPGTATAAKIRSRIARAAATGSTPRFQRPT
jgi:hypothetical protein